MLGVSGEDSVSAESGFYSPIRWDTCPVNDGNVLVHSTRVTNWESCSLSQVLCSQLMCQCILFPHWKWFSSLRMVSLTVSEKEVQQNQQNCGPL